MSRAKLRPYVEQTRAPSTIHPEYIAAHPPPPSRVSHRFPPNTSSLQYTAWAETPTTTAAAQTARLYRPSIRFAACASCYFVIIMAKDDEKKPTAADKGKAKAVNGDAEKKEDTKTDGKDKKVETTGGMSCPRDCCCCCCGGGGGVI